MQEPLSTAGAGTRASFARAVTRFGSSPVSGSGANSPAPQRAFTRVGSVEQLARLRDAGRHGRWHRRKGERRRRRRRRRGAPARHDRVPDAGAADEQRERPEPQEPRRPLDRRPVEDEVAVARDQEGADLVVRLARDRERAHFAAQVLGERRVRVGERLVLAHEAAQVGFEALQARLERDVRRGLRERGAPREHRGEDDQARPPHDCCSLRTSGRILSCSASTLTGPMCL